MTPEQKRDFMELSRTRGWPVLLAAMKQTGMELALEAMDAPAADTAARLQLLDMAKGAFQSMDRLEDTVAAIQEEIRKGGEKPEPNTP